MAVNTAWVSCLDARWTQLCEYRETRTALAIQLLFGDCILAIRTGGPIERINFGLEAPPGLLHTAYEQAGPSSFRLSLADDGDMVKQEWWAWPILGSGGEVGPIINVFFLAGLNQPWPILAGQNEFTQIAVTGAGGDSGLAVAGLGGGGGGGGGFQNAGQFTANVGETWLIDVPMHGTSQLARVRDGSGTVIASASSGANGVNDVAGAGGVPIIGGAPGIGGAGADATFLGGPGGGGGGAGGQAGPSIPDGDAGFPVSDGAGGGFLSLFPGGDGGSPGAPGTAGSSPGGGGGGNDTGTAGIHFGANGKVELYFHTPPTPRNKTITVIESYGLAHDEPDWIDPHNEAGKIAIALPRLSQLGVNALHRLLARIRGEGDGGNRS